MRTWETLRRCHLVGYFIAILMSDQYKTEPIILPDGNYQRNLKKFEEHVRLGKLPLATKPKHYEIQTADGSILQQNNSLDQSFDQEWIMNTPEVTIVLPETTKPRVKRINFRGHNDINNSRFGHVQDNNSFHLNNISIPRDEISVQKTHSILNINLLNSTEAQNFSRLSCEKREDSELLWNSTEAGTGVLAPCPVGYVGSAYRTCFANGQWGRADLFDCRFIKLLELKQLLDYHLVRRLFDGLRHLMEELAIILKFKQIYSILDRLDAMCMISDIMRAKIELILNNCLDDAYIKEVLSSTEKLLIYQDSPFSLNSETHNLLNEKTVDLIQSLAEFSARIVKAYNSNSDRFTVTSPSSLIELVASAREREGDQSTRMNSSDLEDKVSVPHLQDNFHSLKICVIRVKQAGKFLSRDDCLVKSDLVITSLSSEGSSRKGEIEHDIHFKVHNLKFPEGFVIACEAISNETSNWMTGICWIKKREGTNVICRCSRSSVVAIVARKQPFMGHRTEDQRIGPAVMVGCIVCLSAVALVLYATPFYFRTETLALPTIIVNIVIAVAANQVIILLGISATNNEVVCSSVSLLLHYVHLVGSLWLLCYAVHIYRQIGQLSDRSSTILVYCIVSWLLPASFVVSSYIINPKGYETKRYCWLTIQGGMGISFVIPMASLLLLNTVFVLVSMKKFFALRSVTPKSEIEKIRTLLRTGMVILPCFFVNWFFSVLAFEDVFTDIFRYVFAFTNSLQGILIFMFFCALNPKVRRWFKEMIRKKSRCRRLSLVKKKRNSFSTRHANANRRQRSVHTDSYPLLSGSSTEIHSVL